ncbi:MAG: hypothetical protein NT096_00630 [Proteobacteria bacterium]|nr:hypothetical protein [Pseudomonadota bacterium]
MSNGILGTLINSQVAGATAGQAIGPAAAASQALSSLGEGLQLIASGIKGLLGSITSLLPTGSGEGDSNGGSSGDAGVSGGGDGSSSGGGDGNPLVGPQLSGSEAGQGLGPAVGLGESLPDFDLPSTGPQGPIGSSVVPLPNVGGILFENCAAVLTEIGEITGAYWDSQTGSLVVIGKDAQRGSMIPMALPYLDRDHLLVALRAYLAGNPIGVSIDPPVEYRNSIRQGVTPPDGTDMLVSYLGDTESTLFGAIMFEADRLLKCLDKGVNNETRKPVRATVPGFKTLLEMIKPDDGRPENVWHRFWFVIDKVELKHDPATGTVIFGDVRLKVLTETELHGETSKKSVDPIDEAFTKHLTDYYDEYAKDFPVLARLKELAKVAAVAKFLCNSGIPLDLGSIFQADPVHVDTLSTTPGISVTSPNVKIEYKGNVTRTQTVSLFGGVDMEPDLKILPDDGMARQLQRVAESARPSGSVSSWTFRKNGQRARALAQKVGKAHAPFQRICDDHDFSLSGSNGVLRLRRVYNSFSLLKGDFGPGWTWWVPFSITVVPQSHKRPEVLTHEEAEKLSRVKVYILHDHTSGESSLYRQINSQPSGNGQMFCRVTSQAVKKGGVTFQYDPSDYLQGQSDCLVLRRENRQYCFDPLGNLMEVRKENRILIRYHREDGCIVLIQDDTGHSYNIKYSEQRPQRIVGVTCSDGKQIHYSYDELGYLTTFGNGKGGIEGYAYDTKGRLTEIRNRAGVVLQRNVYDDFDNLVTKNSDVLIDKSGHRVRRSFNRGRVVSSNDESSNVALFNYGNNGELLSVEIKENSGRTSRLSYDLKGRLSSFQDSSGLYTYLYYDPSNKVNRVLKPGGKAYSLQRDEEGRLTLITDQNGRSWKAEYDASGNLKNTLAPNGDLWNFRHERTNLVKVSGPPGEVRVTTRRNAIAFRTHPVSGLWQERVYERVLGKKDRESDQRLVKCHTKGTKPVKLHYDQIGNIQTIQNEVGTINFHIDEKELTVTVAFQGI